MINSKWTDACLEEKRGIADETYDKNIEDMLSADFLGKDAQAFAEEAFTEWKKSQSNLIAAVSAVAQMQPADGVLPPASMAKMDELCAAHGEQYKGLDMWRSRVWPQPFGFHIESTRLATLLAGKALANREPAAALAAMNCALANATLLEGRYRQLVKDVALNPDLKTKIEADNLAAYHRFLQLTQDVRRSPNLFLCDDSFRKAQFRSYPRTLHDAFTPLPCPEWVDEEKLRTGFRLWEEHMAACVLVLFTHSLPACYLDAKGIPLLYQSRRLKEQEYLAHRVYETGFFLKDVMDKGGVSVLADPGAQYTAWFAFAVHKVRPELKFELGNGLDPMWTDPEGKTFTYWQLQADPDIQREYRRRLDAHMEHHGARAEDYAAADLGSESFERLFRDCVKNSVGFRGRRLWGPGILTAAKVRYLHAWMRYMTRGRPVAEGSGKPINQEDKAFTLLTIGYLIPLGVEKLGGILSREEKEAFLHCWKIVGHVMGVDKDLLTDDWDEAGVLYEKIKSRQRAPSEPGTILTDALCKLITNLLPAWLPYRASIAPVLIRDQMGADADIVFNPEHKAASRNLPVRVIWAITKHVLLRVYFLSRHWFFDRIPATRVLMDHQIQAMANGMIKCFQQTYDRQRFDLFSKSEGIDPNLAVSDEKQAERLAIRASVYGWASIGVILIVLFHALFWVGAASYVYSFFSAAHWPGSVTKAMLWLCFFDVLGVTLIEGKLRSGLRQLEVKVAPKFL